MRGGTTKRNQNASIQAGPKWVSKGCAENDLVENWLQNDEVQAGPNMTKYRIGPK